MATFAPRPVRALAGVVLAVQALAPTGRRSATRAPAPHPGRRRAPVVLAVVVAALLVAGVVGATVLSPVPGHRVPGHTHRPPAASPLGRTADLRRRAAPPSRVDVVSRSRGAAPGFPLPAVAPGSAPVLAPLP